MAHYARIEQVDGIPTVTRVVFVRNDITHNNAGEEIDGLGLQHLQKLYGVNTNWIRTSINHNIRGCYAGIGYRYDEVNDKFIAPPPEEFPSWVWDEERHTYKPPTPRPELPEGDNRLPMWNEANQEWDLIETENT